MIETTMISEHGHGVRQRVEQIGRRVDVGVGVGEQLTRRRGAVVGER